MTFAVLLFDWQDWLSRPWLWPLLAFQIWMLVDAIRREEWVWAAFIFFFPVLNALLYYFMVYRAAPSATAGFELPGAHQRQRIKELEAQIHHLDKAHHHCQLGDIYFQQGKLPKAETCYRASLERDPTDIDARAHLGQCLARLKRPAEARPLLAQVCAEDPNHDYGHTLMAFAETLAELGERDEAILTWQRVLEGHAYARARVQLAELYLQRGEFDPARTELKEVLEDSAHAPKFDRKRDKPWIRRAQALMSRV
ncbi:MAG: tetratricopeptide repeat protein [Verrucomicrobia bacterium]|nr:tetratricopeptide repeat protein [Verrucomicrobiota bacterium]